jgi:hypothetical protein
MPSLRRALALGANVAVTTAATALAFAVAAPAAAAPRAQTPLECGIAADMAVVAKSLAAEAIDRAKADTIMKRIYDVSQSERGKALMKDITDAAYAGTAGSAAAGTPGNAAAGGSAPADATPDAAQNSAQKFAEQLYATCVKSGGDMDPVLGKRL